MKREMPILFFVNCERTVLFSVNGRALGIVHSFNNLGGSLVLDLRK